jgi:transcriptional regulator with XRE-family HTH domain
MMNVTRAVAAEVRAQMARQQVTGKSIARELSLSQQSISLRLTGKVPFDISELAQVARILGVRIASLIPEEFDAIHAGKPVSAGQTGVMIPCSSPPAAFIFRTKTPRQYRPHSLPIDLPVAA